MIVLEYKELPGNADDDYSLSKPFLVESTANLFAKDGSLIFEGEKVQRRFGNLIDAVKSVSDEIFAEAHVVAIKGVIEEAKSNIELKNLLQQEFKLNFEEEFAEQDPDNFDDDFFDIPFQSNYGAYFLGIPFKIDDE